MKILRLAQYSVPKDADGQKIYLKDKYILRLKPEYIYDADKPYFFGDDTLNKTLGSYNMVFTSDEATVISGLQLLNNPHHWTIYFDAVKLRDIDNYDPKTKLV